MELSGIVTFIFGVFIFIVGIIILEPAAVIFGALLAAVSLGLLIIGYRRGLWLTSRSSRRSNLPNQTPQENSWDALGPWTQALVAFPLILVTALRFEMPLWPSMAVALILYLVMGWVLWRAQR